MSIFVDIYTNIYSFFTQNSNTGSQIGVGSPLFITLKFQNRYKILDYINITGFITFLQALAANNNYNVFRVRNQKPNQVKREF